MFSIKDGKTTLIKERNSVNLINEFIFLEPPQTRFVLFSSKPVGHSLKEFLELHENRSGTKIIAGHENCDK